MIWQWSLYWLALAAAIVTPPVVAIPEIIANRHKRRAFTASAGPSR
jgi:energy-converting hydrogenase Eha subunit A